MQVKKMLPLLESLSNYSWKLFRSDLFAGLIVGIVLVPQGMAYAFMAEMPPIYGLYAGLLPMLIYALFGTARQLSIGPVAIVALLLLDGVGKLEIPGSAAYIDLVITVGLVIGFSQILLSLLRMGFLANFLSYPVILGFTSAAVVIIGINQLKDLLGFSVPHFDYIYKKLLYILQNLDQTNWIAVALCVGSLVFMLVAKRISKMIPDALIVVIIGTLLAWYFNLDEQGVKVLKTIPEGLPAFAIPEFSIEKIRSLLPTVFTVTTIGVVSSIGIAKMQEARQQNYEVVPNKELLALGLAKIAGGFFQAMPTSGSFSRSAINESSGAKTGISSIITMLLIILTLLFLTPLFYYLPNAVLAAIILISLRSFIDLKQAKYLWHSHRRDFMMMLFTFLATLIAGIEEGVFAGVILSIFTVLFRSTRPHIAVLGNLPGTTFYRNIERFEEATEPKDLLIVRFDEQLYFGNAAFFKETIKGLVEPRGTDLKLLILDAGSIHDMDSSGVRVLEEIYAYLNQKDIQFYLCCAIGPVRDMLYKSGLMDKMGLENQFMQIHEAVLAYRNDKHAVDSGAIQTNVVKGEE